MFIYAFQYWKWNIEKKTKNLKKKKKVIKRERKPGPAAFLLKR